MKVVEVEISKIEQEDNLRLTYSEDGIAHLMSSIRSNGLQEPIKIKQVSGGYKVIFGNRRFIACKKLGWKTIPSIIADEQSEVQDAIDHITENAAREDVPLPELGRGYLELRDKKGLNVKEISSLCGASVKSIENAISAFQKVPEKLHHKVKSMKPGKPRRSGDISGQLMTRILSVKKKHAISEGEMEKLFAWAQTEKASSHLMAPMSSLLGSGYSVEDALRVVKKTRNVVLYIPMEENQIRKIEQLYGKGIHQVLYRYISKEFKTLLKLRRSSGAQLRRTSKKKNFMAEQDQAY